jgi:hypothetical protein
MRPCILITRRIYPEAIEFLEQHAQLDYEKTDHGLSQDQLLERAE